jgi:osmotically inducible protein OsmC
MATAERRAEVIWNGDLMSGNGQLTLASSGVLTNTPVTWASRTENPDGRTSPEELLAAAHAACYAMAFSAALARGGTPPQQLYVTAVAAFDRKEGGGFQVTTMDLTVRGRVPGLDQRSFEQAAQTAEQGCPISNALRNNVQIRVHATLEGA